MSIINDTIHDVFTHLCDCALKRKPAQWRWRIQDGNRLRFLRQITQDASLLEPSGNNPTALVSDWLQQPSAEKALILAEAWVEMSDTSARRRCLELVLTLPPDTRISPLALTGRESITRQRSLWLPLLWLGYLKSKPDLALPNQLIIAQRHETHPSLPDWQFRETMVLVHPPFNYADLWHLEQISTLAEIGPPRRYNLAKPAAKLSLLDSPASLDLLERASGKPLPETIMHLFAPYPDVLSQAGVLLTFTNAGELAKLRHLRSWRRRLAHTLSPVHVWVPAAEASILLNALFRRGLSARVLPVPGRVAESRPTRWSSDQLRLLLAARVLGELAEQLDLPAPLDSLTLAELTAGLPAGQQRRLERLVEEQLRLVRQRLAEPRTVLPDQMAGDILTTIKEALEYGQVLQLYYQPPPPRPLITRPVIPLRLEAWGNRTYLLATCLQRRAPRTFRLDRIVGCDKVRRDEATG